MMDIQAFLREFTQQPHTIREIIDALQDKGLSEEEAEKELRKARKNIASVINASEDEILFTSGGTESNNTAIKGYFAANKRAGKHIIVSAVEHPSVAETAKAMETQGFTVDLSIRSSVSCTGCNKSRCCNRIVQQRNWLRR